MKHSVMRRAKCNEIIEFCFSSLAQMLNVMQVQKVSAGAARAIWLFVATLAFIS